MENEWFASWFDTPYYHTLYKNRNHNEAERFINNLLDFLKPNKTDKFVDIACGKGRHSIYLNKKGFNVVGYDLSVQSIEEANKAAKKGLSFYVHDMRQLFRTNHFNYAFNLFTSFGYFKSKRDELNALKASAKNLKTGGKLVIDFLNKEKVIETLISFEKKLIDDIEFNISKEIKNNQVIKTIQFDIKGKSYSFQESVKLLSLNDFNNYLSQANLKITHTFGDYELNAFRHNSDRLIIIAEKIG